MDTERILGFTVLFASLMIVGGLVINMTLSTLLRWRAKHHSSRDSLMEARLARIEAAVEAIAIEIERQGELQRFAAKLDAHRLPESRPIERTTTPH